VRPRPTATLWQNGARPDPALLDYTAGDDRQWDRRLLPWDVLGSLGHVEGLRASGLLTAREHRELRAALRSALNDARTGRLRPGPSHEDVHTAVEDRITRRLGATGERLHTGRSRNDQVACDLRLYLKDRLLRLHAATADLADELLDFAQRNRRVLWPGYTHERRAMPSSAGLWALAFAEGLADTLETLPTVWAALDRSPLGSAAGYGVPLPLRREAAARALGFAGVEHTVTLVQNGRGKLEAAVLFWCTQVAHELAKLATDVIRLGDESVGFLVLPDGLATGSSIMPHKRNPDVFELTRGRASALAGDLVAVLQVGGKLSSGYHRDFQLLKEPVMRGVERLEGMIAAMAVALPQVGVDAAAGRAALNGGPLATDEVMRRVERGAPFRAAYRDVGRSLRAGEPLREPTPGEIVGRRRAPGSLGNLDLPASRARLRACRRWAARERRRFDRAMTTLAGRGVARSTVPARRRP
jgi:argininosuccinate lyase